MAEKKIELKSVSEIPMPIKAGILIGGLVASIISCIYPIVMMAIGASNFSKCPLSNQIPIWLIVAGCVGLLVILLAYLGLLSTIFESSISLLFINFGLVVVGLFSFAWVIVGSVWVYSRQSFVNTSDTTSVNFCQPTLYWFTFWTITLTYVFAGLSLIIGAITSFILCIVFRNAR